MEDKRRSTRSKFCKTCSKNTSKKTKAWLVVEVQPSNSSDTSDEDVPTRPGTSRCKCAAMRRTKTPKASEFVELSSSDSSSSSESHDEDGVDTASAAAASKTCPRPLLESEVECPVCLQPCIHPARTPCGHIFCFLCLKGMAQQSKRCAMCRQQIPPDYLDRPELLEAPKEADEQKETFEDGYQWFYEGRNGWWQFEERTSQDIEEARKTGLTQFQTMICGTLYVIDLQNLTQYNKDLPSRKRKILRDLPSNVVVKGVAGLR